MSNVHEALKAAIAALETSPVIDKYGALKLPALRLCKAALSEIDNCEPVAWQFYQDGKWHNGMDTNNHKQNTIDAGFPVRDIFTSPQPIEKCEPVATIRINEYLEFALDIHPEFDIIDIEPQVKHNLYTSPQPREWVGLNEQEAFKLWDELHPDSEQRSKKDYWLAIEAKLKQLNTKG